MPRRTERQKIRTRQKRNARLRREPVTEQSRRKGH